MISVCYNCKERWITENARCHDTCLAYIEAHKKQVEIQEQKQTYFNGSYISRKALKGMGRK